MVSMCAIELIKIIDLKKDLGYVNINFDLVKFFYILL